MKKLPVTQNPAVLRTDFSNDRAWRSIKKAALSDHDEGDDFTPSFIDDVLFEGLTKDELLAAIPKGYPGSFILVVDQRAITERGHPVLVVKVKRQPGLEFRAAASAIETVFLNLFLANCDFEDFVRSAAKTGVYRDS